MNIKAIKPANVFFFLFHIFFGQLRAAETNYEHNIDISPFNLPAATEFGTMRALRVNRNS